MNLSSCSHLAVLLSLPKFFAPWENLESKTALNMVYGQVKLLFEYNGEVL